MREVMKRFRRLAAFVAFESLEPAELFTVVGATFEATSGAGASTDSVIDQPPVHQPTYEPLKGDLDAIAALYEWSASGKLTPEKQRFVTAFAEALTTGRFPRLQDYGETPGSRYADGIIEGLLRKGVRAELLQLVQ